MAQRVPSLELNPGLLRRRLNVYLHDLREPIRYHTSRLRYPITRISSLAGDLSAIAAFLNNSWDPDANGDASAAPVEIIITANVISRTDKSLCATIFASPQEGVFYSVSCILTSTFTRGEIR